MSSSKHLGRAAVAAGLAITLGILPLAGCATSAASSQDSGTTATTQSASATSGDAVSLIDTSDLVSDRDQDPSYDESSATKIALTDSAATVTGEGAAADGATVTITKAGTYIVTGTVADGQIVVDADGEKVQVVLAGASVTSSSSAALYVKAAKKVFLTLADGTTNTLATTGDYVQTDDNTVDGAIFSKDDLTINGAGTLTVTSASGHGIVCKDDLVLVSGEVSITAARHAIQAKDSVAVVGGTWTLSAGTDGIHAENDDNAEKGFIYVGGGTLDITAESDGFDAANVLQVDGGQVTVAAGDDGLHAELDLAINGGQVSVTKSYEGIEGQTVSITGGVIDVVSSDDGINAAGAPSESSSSGDNGAEKNGENGAAPSGEKGQGGPGANGSDGTEPPAKPDGDSTQTTDGTTAPTGMQEPPSQGDGQQPTGQPGGGQSTDGTTSTDAGQPQAPGNGGQGGDQPGGGQGGGGGDVYDETAQVTITGGTITIQAGGDGIDSNGDFTVTGGVTTVSGPTGGGNGMLDFPGTGTITGGQVFCAGTTDMLQIFGDTSTQGCVAVTISGNAGDTLTLADENGTTIASFSPTTSYQCAVFSVAGIEAGKTYTVSNGTSEVSFTTESLIYNGVSSQGGAGQMGQGGPGQGGGPGGQGQAPSGTPGQAPGDQTGQGTGTQSSSTASTTTAA